MKRRWFGRTVVFALVMAVGAAVLPFPAPAVASAAVAASGDALSSAVDRALFVAAEADGSAAADAAEQIGAEVSGEATGAGEGFDEIPPAPEGANPLPPDPAESVLPGPVEQEGSAEPITIEEPGPPADPGDADLDPVDELVAMRTERTKTYANPDGTFTTESSMSPLHVEDRGGWVEIDVELRERPDGEIENGIAPVDITLASDASSDELATVEFEGDASVAYGLVGAADVEAEVDGAVATYEEILPGVDIELESVPSGLKETAVLASADAPSELAFTVDLEGLTAEVEETGGVALSTRPARWWRRSRRGSWSTRRRVAAPSPMPSPTRSRSGTE